MNYVMATAGHVDHGKSALVKRVTGMDPDRLAEEQARQMTIDLGFAWFKLPSGDEVGVVDVPGHRDFISNMLAGVGSIDAVVVVVAANEGVMPQTREHLAILNLLQVKHGVIAITKIDLVDDQAWLTLVEQDVRDCIQRTTMQDFPFSYVSAFTGVGIPEFITTLQTELKKVQRKIKEGDPRLSIDRVFSIKGFGTVVTGTLLDGTFQIGQEIEIQPSDKRGRIRGIQTHKNKLEKAYPG
ncbi:MAG: selenocysteine-specific translation elongation factor, partial [Chloroflexi bacterium]|nr:selenocysteine-specific translation elongation factor [Chloroflexota bacterium]